jgi:hypothetical protein
MKDKQGLRDHEILRDSRQSLRSRQPCTSYATTADELFGIVFTEWPELLQSHTPEPISSSIEILAALTGTLCSGVFLYPSLPALVAVFWPFLQLCINCHAFSAALSTSWYPLLLPIVPMAGGAYALSFRQGEGWDGKGPHWLLALIPICLLLFAGSWVHIFSSLHFALLAPLLSILAFELYVTVLACGISFIAVVGFSK